MSLRSEGKPITAPQPWTMEASKRILLNLETFYPAIEKTGSDIPDPKRQRTEARPEPAAPPPPTSSKPISGPVRPIAGKPGAVAPRPAAPSNKTPEQLAAEIQERRHRAGMANLYARGVTDAMIKMYYVGWNGKTLVYPRYNAMRQLSELDLGPRIHLEPGDEDGTRFITHKLEDEKRRLQGLPPLYARKGLKTTVDSTGALVLAASQSPGPSSSVSSPLPRPLVSSKFVKWVRLREHLLTDVTLSSCSQSASQDRPSLPSNSSSTSIAGE